MSQRIKMEWGDFLALVRRQASSEYLSGAQGIDAETQLRHSVDARRNSDLIDQVSGRFIDNGQDTFDREVEKARRQGKEQAEQTVRQLHEGSKIKAGGFQTSQQERPPATIGLSQ